MKPGAGVTWCPGSESNRYVPFGTRDFKSYFPALTLTQFIELTSTYTFRRLDSVGFRWVSLESIGHNFGHSKPRAPPFLSAGCCRIFPRVSESGSYGAGVRC